MRPYNIVFNPGSIDDRDFEVAVGVHDVNLGDLVEATLSHDLKMRGRVVAHTAVCSVALHDGSVGEIHQVLDKLRMKVIAIGPLDILEKMRTREILGKMERRNGGKNGDKNQEKQEKTVGIE